MADIIKLDPSIYIGEMKDGVIVQGGEYQTAHIINFSSESNNFVLTKLSAFCEEQKNIDFFNPFACTNNIKTFDEFKPWEMKPDLISTIYDANNELNIVGLNKGTKIYEDIFNKRPIDYQNIEEQINFDSANSCKDKKNCEFIFRQMNNCVHYQVTPKKDGYFKVIYKNSCPYSVKVSSIGHVAAINFDIISGSYMAGQTKEQEFFDNSIVHIDYVFQCPDIKEVSKKYNIKLIQKSPIQSRICSYITDDK